MSAGSFFVSPNALALQQARISPLPKWKILSFCLQSYYNAAQCCFPLFFVL